MSNDLLQKLEDKIDNAIETIELLRLQYEELEDKYTSLLEANATLKNKQITWEQNLTSMLEKLEAIDPNHVVAKKSSAAEIAQTENYAV